MAEFNIQSDSVDVTLIMEQIRQRIREKRGTDYTEQQTHELATVKLERFLDPRQVRSDLVEHYRQLEPSGSLDPFQQQAPVPPAPEALDFDEDTIYVSSRGPMGKLIRLIRKLLSPFLKLFFNLDRIVFALTRQAEVNTWTLQLLQRQATLYDRVGKKFAAREELDALNYEVLNNLVVEMTRLSVDMKNHKMRVESVAGRLDFDERRARALESVVQTRSPQPAGGGEDAEGDATATNTGRTRRRRRRSRRRSGTATPRTGTEGTPSAGTLDQRDTTKPLGPTEPAAPAANTPAPDPAQAQTEAAAAAPAPLVQSPPPDITPAATPEANTAVGTEPPVTTPSPAPVALEETAKPPLPRADADTDEQ